MNYQKLLKRHNWLSIQDVLIQIYPDQKHLISSYEHVYNELMTLEPEQTDLTLEIYKRFIEGLDDEPLEPF